MKRNALILLLTAALAVPALAASADTRDDGPAEKTGRQIDQVTQTVRKALGTAATATGNALHKAGDAAGNAVRKAGEVVGGVAKEAGDAMRSAAGEDSEDNPDRDREQQQHPD